MTTSAIIIGLRKGQGVDEIAHDLDMTPDQVRMKVDDLRETGVLPETRWKPIGLLARNLLERVAK